MKKILVYLESHNGDLNRTSYEALTAARNLAEAASVPFAGLIINSDEATLKKAADYGLQTAMLVNNDLLKEYSLTAYAKVIALAANEIGADCLMMAGDVAGLELAPRVAAKLNAGYISDCVGLEYTDGEIRARKPVYAGKSMILTKVTVPNQVYTLRPNVFTAVSAAQPANLALTPFNPELTTADKSVVVTKVSKNEGKLDVLEADIIVSGGRGVKGPENYNLVESLASVLGAAVGASRAVVDAGWRPHMEQVGQTGKTVSPTMYVACGISGAVQHLAGMSSSKIIFAINKDKDAPIFKIADYGIVGDLFTVLPKLTAKIKEAKSN
jgi:electron transfer flavoprotein alpha subunit